MEPTFFMADNPNLTWFFLGTTEKKVKLSLMSGGRTSSPIFLHSVIKTDILSTSFLSEVRSAAMNSAGKWALRYAVW